MKNYRWFCLFVKESKYNHYEGVDPKKLRPCFVWINNVKTLKNYCLSFYCPTKFDRFSKSACIKIDKDSNPSFRKDTYVWIHKPIIIWKKHFTKFNNEQTNTKQYLKCKIIDKNTRKKIANKINEIYTNLLTNKQL